MHRPISSNRNSLDHRAPIVAVTRSDLSPHLTSFPRRDPCLPGTLVSDTASSCCCLSGQCLAPSPAPSSSTSLQLLCRHCTSSRSRMRELKHIHVSSIMHNGEVTQVLWPAVKSGLPLLHARSVRQDSRGGATRPPSGAGAALQAGVRPSCR